MKLMVFGQTGQVAQALGQLMPDALFLSRAQADLEHPAQCAAAIAAHRPDAVINAAAWTAVDAAESDEARAHIVNADSPGAMARACAQVGAAMVQISTDYVFDGSGTAPWAPDSPCAPLNAYGRTKLAGEEQVRAAHAATGILRTSWVFSAQGANFLRTMLRLSESRDSLSIVADQVGGPTPAGAIARAAVVMAQALRDGHPAGTWHIAGRPDASWADFAEWIFACAGRDVAVTRIPTSAYPTSAARPLNSRLDCTNLLRDFALAQPDWKAQSRADVRSLLS